MQNNSSLSIFCIFCILQYAKYAEYVVIWHLHILHIAAYFLPYSICRLSVVALLSSWKARKGKPGYARAEASTHAQSNGSFADQRGDSSGWDHRSRCSRAILPRSILCNLSFPSYSEILWSLLHQVLGPDFLALGDPTFVWHLLLRQHLISLLWAGKRKEPEEAVDISMKLWPISGISLASLPFFFNLTHIQNLKYAIYTKYAKHVEHTRGACNPAAHRLQRRIWEQIWAGSSGERGQFHDES